MIEVWLSFYVVASSFLYIMVVKARHVSRNIAVVIYHPERVVFYILHHGKTGLRSFFYFVTIKREISEGIDDVLAFLKEKIKIQSLDTQGVLLVGLIVLIYTIYHRRAIATVVKVILGYVRDVIFFGLLAAVIIGIIYAFRIEQFRNDGTFQNASILLPAMLVLALGYIVLSLILRE